MKRGDLIIFDAAAVFNEPDDIAMVLRCSGNAYTLYWIRDKYCHTYVLKRMPHAWKVLTTS